MWSKSWGGMQHEQEEIVRFCGKLWAEQVKDEEHPSVPHRSFTLDSTGHCKTVLNNDGFCQLFNTRPPSPLCHYVIISSTPSLPCLLPSPNRHITKHTQWHCAFSHHHFWHSMRRHPLPSLLPSAHFWCVGWRRACSLIERFIMLSKGGNGAALSRSAGGGIRGSGCRAPAAANPRVPTVCVRDLSEKGVKDLRF